MKLKKMAEIIQTVHIVEDIRNYATKKMASSEILPGDLFVVH
jgi:hypothetical protein